MEIQGSTWHSKVNLKVVIYMPKEVIWCYSKMFITHKQTLNSTTLKNIIFGFHVGTHYQWQSTNQFKKKIDFVTIKFHLNENIEWHLHATWYWIEFKYIEWKLNSIES